MMKKIFLLLSFVTMVIAASAIPAKRGVVRQLTLANGQTITVKLVGDEFMHYYVDDNGQTYVEGIHGLEAADQTTMTALTQQAQLRRNAVSAHRAKRAPRKVGGTGKSFLGKKKGLIILTQFTDTKFETAHDQAYFEKVANEENFSHPDGFTGSVYDYFKAQSGGLFELTFDVVGPVTLSQTASYYGRNTGNEDMRPGAMIAQACQAVDGMVDFKDYDWDGDGEVDQVFVLYAGQGEADGGSSNTIWPHEWELASSDYGRKLTLDGVAINTYACSNELATIQEESGGYWGGTTTTTAIAGIGAICHEFSHCLGFPDMYDTGYTHYGMACWDLMDSGSYNGDSFTPAGYTSYEKWVAGWLQPIELKSQMQVVGQKALSEGGDAYIIYNDAHKDEFYLLENRQLTGWDAELPAAGLLVLHVDYDATAWYNNTVNNASHQRCTVVPADNNLKMDYYYGSYYANEESMLGDPYPYGLNDSLSNTSKPATTLYNATTTGNRYLNVSVNHITQLADGTIAFNFVDYNDVGSEPIEVPEGDYVKITEADDIVDGMTFVLVNEEYRLAAAALGAQYFTSVSVALNADQVSGADMAVFQLSGNETDGYAVKMADGKYLTAVKNKELKAQTTPSPIWNVKEASTGGYVLTTDAYGTIQFNYNSGNTPRFMNYTSNQKPAVIFAKKQETTAISHAIATQDVMTTQAVFDLQGRKVANSYADFLRNHPAAKGIYIYNGKKIMK